jgi:hypothetical protein
VPNIQLVTPFHIIDEILAAQVRLAHGFLGLWARPAQQKPVQQKRTEVPVPDEAIQARAYELYVQRGQQPGHELEDWERARTELLAS